MLILQFLNLQNELLRNYVIELDKGVRSVELREVENVLTKLIEVRSGDSAFDYVCHDVCPPFSPRTRSHVSHLAQLDHVG